MSLLNSIGLLAQESGAAGAGMDAALLVYLALILVAVIGGWKMYEKAGEPGWGIIIPIYNIYILTKIAGRPGWWLLLMLIPIVSLIIMIIVMMDIAKAFGRGAGTGLGLAFLPFIFYPILGFGSAQYQRTA